MDKHDRPYKCGMPGCEKLPGFTYSGGLLRHEREVHGKHGGPKNSFYCPHINCKRHTGKGFSRQENLNEHLRRVHTQNPVGAANGGRARDSTPIPGAADADLGSASATSSRGVTPTANMKRKRDASPYDDDVRLEIKRVREENAELRRQTDLMMEKITALQNALGTRLSTGEIATPQMPTAPMV